MQCAQLEVTGSGNVVPTSNLASFPGNRPALLSLSTDTNPYSRNLQTERSSKRLSLEDLFLPETSLIYYRVSWWTSTHPPQRVIPHLGLGYLPVKDWNVDEGIVR